MKKHRVGTFLAPSIMPLYQVITDEIGRQLGVETELVVETDYDDCKNDINDVCFVCSLPYVEFERQGISISEPIAAPVLIGDRYQGKPIYFSDVIVHKDSPFKTFENCKVRPCNPRCCTKERADRLVGFFFGLAVRDI